MIGIIGSTNVDIVINVEHFTLPGETQKSSALYTNFGGKGANQAMTVARLTGKDTYFCTAIGNDDYGKNLENVFLQNNIKGYFKSDTETGRAYIEVNSSGENRIIIHPGANSTVDKEKIDKFLELYSENIDYCLIQNEIPHESIIYAIEKLKNLGITIIYDPAPKESTDISILKYVDFLTPNETEFDYLFRKVSDKEISDLSEKGIIFRNITGVKNLIIKNGSKGSIFIDENNNVTETEAIKVKAVDSTAAGDIFNGSFTVWLSENNSVTESISFAGISSGISVTRKGAQNSIPEISEILEIYKK
ncbi:MAG: ribokinase [Thermotogae bacterium]|nr:ribokinase [Thermotogota bacterium]